MSEEKRGVISITGLEAERSDVAPITKTAQQAFAETLRMDDSTAREQLFPQLREWADDIESGDMASHRVCKRGGIGQNLNEYGSRSRRPAPIYRGAKYTNNHIDGVTVQRGDKPACIRLSKITGDYPTTYSTTTAEDGDVVDAVSLPDPSMLPDEFVIDWDTHIQKVLIDPMKPLLETRFGQDAWSQIRHQHKQEGLSSFAAD